jgi:hypothetical protein
MGKSRLSSILFLALVLTTIHLTPSFSQAQTDPDEAYDPFTDYSEFDEASDEEADINFFRNGRFFSVGFVGGPRFFTENMSKVYGSGPALGLSISYFFDLRMAFTLGLMTGDHSVNIETNTANYTGNASFTFINMDLKYYVSTQNVTKGLADLNPYVLGGFSQVARTYTISGIDTQSRESVMATDLGAGIEIPLMRRKAFLGLQYTYHYVGFADENGEFITTNSGQQRLIRKINGDTYDLLFILGLNY